MINDAVRDTSESAAEFALKVHSVVNGSSPFFAKIRFKLVERSGWRRLLAQDVHAHENDSV